MADTTISPNMGMPVPTVSEAPGPGWATNIDSCLSILDAHTHSAGSGVQVTPDGLNINSDLTFVGNNATVLRSARFDAQIAALSDPADVGCLYVSGVDLYYNDGNGNQIRVTASGSVTGATGTITGLPSGTASASYAGGTFTFQGATNTPATMNIGPIVTGAATANSKTWTISASASQASNLTLTLPLTAPAANQLLISDGSGNLSWTLGLLPVGSVVATFPNLTGAYSTAATTVADAYGFVKCQGQTIADATSPMNGQVVPNINNSVFLMGSTTAGTSGGAATVTLITANLPGHTHSFTSSNSVAATNHTHSFLHNHQVAYTNGATDGMYMAAGSAGNQPIWSTSGGGIVTALVASTDTAVGGIQARVTASGVRGYYTSGALNPPSGTDVTNPLTGVESATTTVTGTTGSTGSGTAFNIAPVYISTVYLMRVK